MKRLQVVDLVRAVSILAVLAHHLGLAGITQPSQPYAFALLWFKIWANGPYGVSMFFVISGFVITRLIASGPGGLFHPNYRDFYVRRIGRIIPLLALTCLLGLGVSCLWPSTSPGLEHCIKDPNASFTAFFWTSIITFCFNWYIVLAKPFYLFSSYGLQFSVLWSLSIEEQFYFFYPFLLRLLGQRRNLTVFLGILIALGPLTLMLGNAIYSNFTDFSKNSFASFGLITLGCLLYLTVDLSRDYLSKNRNDCFYLCGTGLLLIGVTYWHVIVRINYWWNALGQTLIGIGVFFFLLGALHLDFFSSKRWAFMGRLGKLSYGGYLYHPLVLFLLWPFLAGKNEFLAFFIFASATFGLAELSFRFFEIPANLWIRKKLGTPPPSMKAFHNKRAG